MAQARLVLPLALVHLMCCILTGTGTANNARGATAAGVGETPEIGSNRVIWFPDPSDDAIAGETVKYIPAFINGTQDGDGNAIPANLDQLHFYLYTRENLNTPDELIIDNVTSLETSHFIRGANLKVLVHGFGGRPEHSFPWHMKDELLHISPSVETNNVILVDWGNLATSPDYLRAYVNAGLVAQQTAHLLAFILNQEAIQPAQIHLIGYSLGGQLVGIAGHRFKGLTGHNVSRVTSLDPAKPLFELVPDTERVSANAADFVDVIHTNAGFLGVVNPRGTVDFYPNGGAKQPGCGVDMWGGCSHGRAPAFFQESIAGANLFRACACTNWDEFDGGSCECSRNGTKTDLGYWIDMKTRGKFYLRTNPQRPYAMQAREDGLDDTSGAFGHISPNVYAGAATITLSFFLLMACNKMV